MKLAGWGNYPVVDATLAGPSDPRFLAERVARASTAIARGAGRGYGDAALNPDLTLSMLGLDRMMGFDPDTGRLTCEAGVMLADILALFLPKGWFPPVTPGTKFVTVGGMIAADVHGKNHHVAGSFGRHVESLDLMLADGSVVACSRAENPDLFRATVGGVGLTGIVLAATFRLIRVETAWIKHQTLVAANLAEAMDLFEQSGDWTYSVAWIDCLARGNKLGRSLLYCGAHAVMGELSEPRRAAPLSVPRKRSWRVPLPLPPGVLNRWTVRLFNERTYRRGAARAGDSVVDYDTFFYPLDWLRDWNRLYRRGFTQYQCVFPKAASREGMLRLLKRIGDSGQGSSLSTLKLFGPQAPDGGFMSFPMEGYTLALDFPVTRSVLRLFHELDAIVLDHDGRLNLAKDARAPADVIARGYPDVGEFVRVRNESGAATKFHSALSRRLAL